MPSVGNARLDEAIERARRKCMGGIHDAVAALPPRLQNGELTEEERAALSLLLEETKAAMQQERRAEHEAARARARSWERTRRPHGL